MNKILILFLSFGLYACAPENDPLQNMMRTNMFHSKKKT